MKKKILIIICGVSISSSCEKVNCDKIAEDLKNDELWIVFFENNSKKSYHSFDITGKNKFGRDTLISEENRYLSAFKEEYFEKGDTIIKKKGETTLYIHKKDTTLSFPFECDGKIYK